MALLDRDNIQPVFFTEITVHDRLSAQFIRNQDLTDLHTVIQHNIIQEIAADQTFSKADRHILFRINDFRSDFAEDCSLFRAHGLGDDLGHSKLEHAHGNQNACVDLLTYAHRHHITVLDPCLLQAFHIDGFCHKCIIRVLADRLYFIFVPVNGDHILARL